MRVAVPLLILLAACPQETAVWVAEGSTASELTLVFGRERGRERPISVFVRVDRCEDPNRGAYDGKALWMADINASRATYGVPGPGVSEQMKPEPLTPGCYYVSTTGTGATAVVIDSAGRVAEYDPLP